jgi:nicotinamidase-related amidase
MTSSTLGDQREPPIRVSAPVPIESAIQGRITDMTIDTRRSAVLALHWQVNVIKPEGFFGAMLAEPVARSGVVARATHFHGAALAAGLPVLFTRFTVPPDGGQLVTNTAFMTAVAASGEAFLPDAPGAGLIPEMAAWAEPDRVFDNQKLSGLAGSNLPQWLAGHDIDTVLITGVATNLTVEQTARHATDLGLTTYVISDCVAAADETIHAASLANLELATAGCRTADQVLGVD